MNPARNSHEAYWRARARALAQTVNLGWWWHQLTPALVGINLAAAAALLLYRQMHWPVLSWIVCLGVAWLAASLWSLRQARARFYSDPEGLLRLETHLGWHNRLSAAAAGGVAWPAPTDDKLDPVRWRLKRTSGPLVISAVFLLLGIFLPIGSGAKANLPPPAQPPTALRQVETWLETLKEEKIVEPTALQNWDERAMEIRLKPSREWYGQEGLEAAESLRDQMTQEIDTLGKNLLKAAALANAMSQMAPDSRPSQMDSAMDATLSNLQNSGLPVSQNLAAGMASAAQLSQPQLQQLAQQLQQAANAVNPGASSSMPSLGEVLSALGQNNGGLSPDPAPAQGFQGGQGQPGQGQGQGQPGQGQGNGQGQGQGQGQGNGQGQGQGQGRGNGQGQGQGQGQGNGQGQGQGNGQGQGQGMGQGQGQGQGQGNGQGQQGQGQQGGGQVGGGDGSGQAAPFVPTGAMAQQYGPGAAPLSFGTPTDLQSAQKEGVSNPNTDSPMPGETLGITLRGSDKPDGQQDLLNSTGGGGQAGTGGDAVWLQDLTPQERAVIKRYFK
jgi:hypothetical protein